MLKETNNWNPAAIGELFADKRRYGQHLRFAHIIVFGYQPNQPVGQLPCFPYINKP